MTKTTIDPIKKAAILARYQQLRKMRKDDLRQVVRQSYRVIDLSEADKQSLISLILSSQFGRNYDQAF